MKNKKNLCIAVALGALTLAGCGGSGGATTGPAISDMTVFINMQSAVGQPSQLYKFNIQNPNPVAITSVVQGVHVATTNALGNTLYFNEGGMLKSIKHDGTSLATYSSIGNVESLALNSAGNQIAFTDDGDFGLYRADSTGGNVAVVVPDVPTTSRNVAYSPDGTKIYFSERSDANGTTDISSVLPNGTQKTNLTEDFSPGAHHPSPSPDGTKIVFAIASAIYEMDANGQNKRKITDADEPEELTYSPDGQWVLYSESNGERKIWIAKVDGTYKKRLLKTSAPMLKLVGAKSF